MPTLLKKSLMHCIRLDPKIKRVYFEIFSFPLYAHNVTTLKHLTAKYAHIEMLNDSCFDILALIHSLSRSSVFFFLIQKMKTINF